MGQKYYSVNDSMRQFINHYSLNLINDIYEDDDVVEPIDDLSFQVLNSDDNLEKLYSELLEHINKQNPIVSITYKRMIMAYYYEYINMFYDDVDSVSQQIYLRLCDNLNIKDIIELFDKNSREIIEMYDYILSVYENFPEIVTKIRNKIIQEHKIKDIFRINPGSILDYRFLFGCKFDEEKLPSIHMTNLLTSIVDKVNIGNLDEDRIIKEIQQLLETEPQIKDFVNDQKSYIIANIYARFNEHKCNDERINNFIRFIETTDEDIVLESINIENEGLSTFLYIFYLLNKEGLTEDKLKHIVDENKKQKKYNLVKLYNPYSLEEEEYFKHWGH